MSLVIGADYGWCVMVAGAIAFQITLEGIFAGRLRRKFFTPDFWKKNFPKKNPKDYPEGGYPDMGSGLYASKLDEEDWVTFNNAQRAHYNYLEGVASILALELLSGLFFPQFSAVVGVAYVIGRALYGIGYRSKGSKGRMIGVALVDLSLIALWGATLYGGFTFAGGIGALKHKFGL